MNFEHTHERRLLGESISRYVADRFDEVTRRMVPQQTHACDRTHWNALVELGALGALFDPAYGGYGGSGFDVMAVFEAAGRGLVASPLLACLMAGRALAAAGGSAPSPLLAAVVEGEALATLAHCEPGGQWDPAHVECTARREGEGWVLQGRKVAVPWGAEANTFVVSARTAGVSHDAEGISLFVVPAGSLGLAVRGYPGIDGTSYADIALDGVQLPADALAGPAGQAAGALADAIGHGVLAVCAEALGVMGFVMDATLDYLRTRKQFGSPIGSFQAVQHRMVDLMLHVEQARSATINGAAHMASAAADRGRYVAAAKFTVGSAALAIAQECIQLHGGIGMTWELPLSHYAKRLAMINFTLGDEDFHLARFAGLSTNRGNASA